MGDGRPVLVLDASVAVKWFLAEDEQGIAEAADLLDRHASGRMRLVAPTLIAHELMGVFARRMPAVAWADAIDAFFDAGVELVSPDRALMLETARLTAERQLSPYDAAYAGLASLLSCPLATADRRLARALSGAVESLRI